MATHEQPGIPMEPAPAGSVAVQIEGLRFSYPGATFAFSVGSLTIEAGERVAFIGPSGSGKTTLLHLIAGILVPDLGRVLVQGQDTARCGDAQRRRLRITSIGMVFQEFELLDYLSVGENILLPYYINPALTLDQLARQHAEELARTAGLGDCLDRLPRRLSHGERQRVAICRSLVTGPALVLADEPTGNLDPDTTGKVLDLLAAEVARGNSTLLLVTHDHSLLGRFDRVVDFGELLQEASR